MMRNDNLNMSYAKNRIAVTLNLITSVKGR